MRIAALPKAYVSKSFTFGLSKRRTRKGSLEESLTTPPLILDSLSYLQKHNCIHIEGIFRVTGSIADIERLAKDYDKGKGLSLACITDVHTVAGLLKHYLRTRRGGIIPLSLHEFFFAASNMTDEATKVMCVAKALRLVSPTYMQILLKTFEYLHEVHLNEEFNKMSASNLATVFSDTLLPCSATTMEQALSQNNQAQECVELIIRHYKKIAVIMDTDHPEEEVPTEVRVFAELMQHYNLSKPSSPPKKKNKAIDKEKSNNETNNTSNNSSNNTESPPQRKNSSDAPTSPLCRLGKESIFGGTSRASFNGKLGTGSMINGDSFMSTSSLLFHRKKSNAGITALSLEDAAGGGIRGSPHVEVLTAEKVCSAGDIELLVKKLMNAEVESYYKQLVVLSDSNAGMREKLQRAALHISIDQRALNSTCRVV